MHILLQPGGVELIEASNVLSPQVNNLDLRFRKQAQFRALEQVRIGYFQHKKINRFENDKFENNLFSLCRSVPTLYPRMEVQPIKLFDLTDNINELNCDLIYFEYQDFINLQALKLEQLQQFIKTGAVIVVEVSALEANIAELDSVKQQLQTTIKNLLHQPEIIQVRQDLEMELDAVNIKIIEQLEAVTSPIRNFVEQLGIKSSIEDTLPDEHLLRNYPFLFSQLPVIEGENIYLFNCEGIILIVGALSSTWGTDNKYSFSRETIRSAQEMGINILYFAWYRHQLAQLTIKY